ncbi:uncharacterized protein [Nicotiana tomentosiformis]|uniref:uncharacterized protein n=1 Tax=Nicotiana tomentosiformis TaxID=4098 RepID=UPI00388CBE9A
MPVCYACGMRGHIQRECRASHQHIGRGTTQSSSATATTSSAPPPARGSPAPTGRDAARGGAQSLGGPNRFYAMSGRQSAEASPDVVTGILTIQSHDVYALIYPRSSLSYVTPYVATSFGIESKQLHEPFSVSTTIGKSIMAARFYRDCVVTVHGRDTMANLIELGMIDVDVIMGIDWLYSCFSKLDCRARNMRLEFPNEPAVEWEGNNVMPKDELPGILPDREIYFGIDVMPGTQPISIPPYRMASVELKELKEQLGDLLEKDALSRKSISSLAHLEACQRPLAREVHQLASLGVCLADSNEEGMIVRSRVESSLVMEVKEKQYNDPVLV